MNEQERRFFTWFEKVEPHLDLYNTRQKWDDGFSIAIDAAIELLEAEFDSLAELGAEKDYILGLEHAILLLKNRYKSGGRN